MGGSLQNADLNQVDSSDLHSEIRARSSAAEPNDVPRGLFGAIIVAGRGTANATGGAWDVDEDDEVALFFLNMAASDPATGAANEYYTINGVAFGNLDMSFQQGHNVRVHHLALGSSDDLHPIHWCALARLRGLGFGLRAPPLNSGNAYIILSQQAQQGGAVRQQSQRRHHHRRAGRDGDRGLHPLARRTVFRPLCAEKAFLFL